MPNPFSAPLADDFGQMARTARDNAKNGDLRGAITLFDRLLRHDPEQTDYRKALAACYCDLKEYENAYRQLAWSLAEEPYNPALLERMSYVCSSLGRHEEAERYVRECLRIAPHCAIANWNHSIWTLGGDDWKEGWSAYQWRHSLKVPEVRSRIPEWDGSPLPDGAHLYLSTEQGLGDTLFAIRLVGPALRHAQREGSRIFVTVEVQAKLLPLLVGMNGPQVRIVAQQTGSFPVGDFDAWAGLFRLPPILGLDTREAFGAVAEVPYLGATPAQEVRAGAEDALHVGLCWRGNPEFKGDTDRSIHDVSVLEPLLSIPGIVFHCLVPDAGRVDGEAAMLERYGVRVYNLVDFAATASVIAACDAVVTTCTSIAHLAGAMGAKTFVMLSHDPDWRWGRERVDSPIYPTATLFRQGSAGDWQGVIRQITDTLSLAAVVMEGGAK